jgi:tungstate transport system substrate-binding protein
MGGSGFPLVDHPLTLIKDGKEVKGSFKNLNDSDSWYISIGQGMVKTITYDDENKDYTLSNHSTYINYQFGKKPAVEVEILFGGDELLVNPYGVIPGNLEKFSNVHYDLAMKLAQQCPV